MNSELLSILEHIEQERGIDRETLVDAVEQALLSASRKSIHPAKDLDVKVDRNTGEIRAWARLEVVESNPTSDQLLIERAREKFPDVKPGDVVDWEVTPKNFGRIAAQTAKQAILQQLRKAEKAIVKEEFEDKIGDIVNGTVRRFEAGNIIVDFMKAEGIITPREKIPGEQYMQGDRISALLLKVETIGSGPSLILSRAHPDFVRRLFEREVTEIHDGVVEIVAIAREAGNRTKIAVVSNDPRIDPIGACVGMRGMRVKNITNELGGERVDIIKYEEDIRAYAASAIQPAKPSLIDVIESERTVNIYVAADQTSRAYGKKAQNVRLCAKLIGWNVNILVEDSVKVESFEEKLQRTIAHLSEALELDEELVGRIVRGGYVSIEGLKGASMEDLMALDGVSEEDADRVMAVLNSLG
ncbi:MAG: transcription termination factor NusA [Lentisphaerae bacterium GWF2_45_14]|nr:MAG: transcription termination factor NusA [Lentisphaerae bacterium GWF2_45_14]